MLKDNMILGEYRIKEGSHVLLSFVPSVESDIKLLVMMWNAIPVTIDVKLKYPVTTIKRIVSSTIGVSCKHLVVFHGRLRMEDELTLEHYSLQPDSVIYLLPAIGLRIRPESQDSISLRVDLLQNMIRSRRSRCTSSSEPKQPSSIVELKEEKLYEDLIDKLEPEAKRIQRQMRLESGKREHQDSRKIIASCDSVNMSEAKSLSKFKKGMIQDKKHENIEEDTSQMFSGLRAGFFNSRPKRKKSSQSSRQVKPNSFPIINREILNRSTSFQSTQEFKHPRHTFEPTKRETQNAYTIATSQVQNNPQDHSNKNTVFGVSAHKNNPLRYSTTNSHSNATHSSKTSQKQRLDSVRCQLSSCGKKLSLCEQETGRCRCGKIYCTKHRLSDDHSCLFDYKANTKKELQKSNPMVKGHQIGDI